MIRAVIKPQDSSFVIDIPNNYIDKEVEFIMFLLDESESVHKVKQQDISLLGRSLKSMQIHQRLIGVFFYFFLFDLFFVILYFLDYFDTSCCISHIDSYPYL